MSDNTVDIERLAALYHTSPGIRAVVDWLNDREREPRNSETKASNLKIDLASRGERFEIEDLRQVLETFAKAGCGKYQVGRPLEKSRLTWDHSARAIAKKALAAAKSRSKDHFDGTSDVDPNSEMHYFPVRPGVTLPISIRRDMSAEELENLSEFVKVIARSRASSEAQP